MPYNLPRLVFMVISTLSILSVIVIIIFKTLFGGAGNSGLEFSLFGDLMG